MAILDADKEGFLRSQTSLIQTIGRAARNVNATVFLYADTVTESMQKAMDETNRRRTIQTGSTTPEHGITPETIRKEIRKGLTSQIKARKTAREAIRAGGRRVRQGRDGGPDRAGDVGGRRGPGFRAGRGPAGPVEGIEGAPATGHCRLQAQEAGLHGSQEDQEGAVARGVLGLTAAWKGTTLRP